MPLAELQQALAHLYTREDARRAFASDFAAFAERFGLKAADRERLAAVAGVRLHAYVDSLDRKRANEAARMLPLSARALGPAFRSNVLRYARRRQLRDCDDRYRTDAIAFARSLDRQLLAAIGEPCAALLRFEADGLAASRRFPAVRLAVYRYDPFEVARVVARGDSPDICAPARTVVAFLGSFRVRFSLLTPHAKAIARAILN
jgi:hypothetical protein